MKKLFFLIAFGALFGVMIAQGQSGNASIYIKRPAFVGAAWIHYLEINGVYVGQVKGGDCYKIIVPPGTYVVNYYNGALMTLEAAKQLGPSFSIPRNLAPGEELFVQVKIKATGPSYEIETGGKGFSKYKEIDFAVLQQMSQNNNAALAQGDITEQQVSEGVMQQQTFNDAGAIVGQQQVSLGAQQQVVKPETTQPVITPVEKPISTSTADMIVSDVDVNVPQTNNNADDTFVLIIANEDYQFVDDVKYAVRDGETFREYCIKTLGVPERQVRYCPNASYGIISGGVDWLRYALENFEGSKGIVYYCGHGIPDEKTNAAYIVPVDGKGTNMATCVSLNGLYKTLAGTGAARVTYFMDACFTGANKEGSMLVAARGVACKPKPERLEGNTIVFSASSGDETAMTYEEKKHGLFTYYLLKKLQETAGDVSYEDLSNYVIKNVKKDAFLLNEKPQNPVVATSPAASATWKKMKLE